MNCPVCDREMSGAEPNYVCLTDGTEVTLAKLTITKQLSQPGSYPPRLFAIGDIIETPTQLMGRIFGYEWSDGGAPCGSPRTTYIGWFYHIHLKKTGETYILPERSISLRAL